MTLLHFTTIYALVLFIVMGSVCRKGRWCAAGCLFPPLCRPMAGGSLYPAETDKLYKSERDILFFLFLFFLFFLPTFLPSFLSQEPVFEHLPVRGRLNPSWWLETYGFCCVHVWKQDSLLSLGAQVENALLRSHTNQEGEAIHAGSPAIHPFSSSPSPAFGLLKKGQTLSLLNVFS